MEKRIDLERRGKDPDKVSGGGVGGSPGRPPGAPGAGGALLRPGTCGGGVGPRRRRFGPTFSSRFFNGPTFIAARRHGLVT